MNAPALVAISHGTDSVAGRRLVGALVAAVRERVPDTRSGFVDVLQPDVATVLRKLPAGRAAVIVPLLLSAGYHVRVDIARAAGASGRPVAVAGALGPDDALVVLLARRLGEAGVAADDELLLAAAGSSDAAAVADCRDTGGRLAALLGRPVTTAFLSAASPTVADAVAAARRSGRRVVVATYLLAPGYFESQVIAAGADVTARPLLDGGPVPAELVDAVVRRYLAAAPLTAAVGA